MSDLMIPGPSGSEPTPQNKAKSQGQQQEKSSGRRRRTSRSAKPAIPSADDCARAIAQVAGLVAIGLLKPAQANAIRAAFRDIQQYHKSKAKEADNSLSNADVMNLLRKDPTLLNMLEPLLTDEQIDQVMRNKGAGDEQA